MDASNIPSKGSVKNGKDRELEVEEIRNAIPIGSGADYEADILSDGSVLICDYEGAEVDLFDGMEEAKKKYVIL